MSSNDVYGRSTAAVSALGRLDAAVCALSSVDLGKLSDTALSDSLDQLSTALCRVDLLLSRLAEETRSRGFTIMEGPVRGDRPGQVDAIRPARAGSAESATVIELALRPPVRGAE